MENKNEIEIIDFDEIDVYSLKGNRKDNPENLHKIYAESFKCWHDTWNDFFHGDHDTKVKLSSTEFTRQDDVLALFYKGECFAISFFKEVDWSDSTARLDSYFNPWPNEAIEGLIARGKKVLICSQFTVSKNYRGGKTDIPWKYVLSGFIMTRFLNSTADAMTGTMRVSRGMGKVSVKEGAIPLMTNIECEDHLGEIIDLVAFFQKEVSDVYNSNPYHTKFDNCWSRLNGIRKTQLRLVA